MDGTKDPWKWSQIILLAPPAVESSQGRDGSHSKLKPHTSSTCPHQRFMLFRCRSLFCSWLDELLQTFRSQDWRFICCFPVGINFDALSIFISVLSITVVSHYKKCQWGEKKGYGSRKGKITNVGVNRQQVHKYLAFIHTHLKVVTLFRFQIGVISCVAPHYVRVSPHPPSLHKSLRQEKLVLCESWEAHVGEKLIINT